MSVKLSPKYQVVIPTEIRESLGLKPGQEIDVIAKGNIAYLVPVKSLKEIQALLKGTTTQDKLSAHLRDKKDRF